MSMDDVDLDRPQRCNTRPGTAPKRDGVVSCTPLPGIDKRLATLSRRYFSGRDLWTGEPSAEVVADLRHHHLLNGGRH